MGPTTSLLKSFQVLFLFSLFSTLFSLAKGSFVEDFVNKKFKDIEFKQVQDKNSNNNNNKNENFPVVYKFKAPQKLTVGIKLEKDNNNIETIFYVKENSTENYFAFKKEHLQIVREGGFENIIDYDCILLDKYNNKTCKKQTNGLQIKKRMIFGYEHISVFWKEDNDYTFDLKMISQSIIQIQVVKVTFYYQRGSRLDILDPKIRKIKNQSADNVSLEKRSASLSFWLANSNNWMIGISSTGTKLEDMCNFFSNFNNTITNIVKNKYCNQKNNKILQIYKNSCICQELVNFEQMKEISEKNFAAQLCKNENDDVGRFYAIRQINPHKHTGASNYEDQTDENRVGLKFHPFNFYKDNKFEELVISGRKGQRNCKKLVSPTKIKREVLPANNKKDNQKNKHNTLETVGEDEYYTNNNNDNNNNNNEKNKILIKKEEEKKINKEKVEPKLTESSSSSEIINTSNNEEIEDKTNIDNPIKKKDEFDNNVVIVDGGDVAAAGGGGVTIDSNNGLNAGFSAEKTGSFQKKKLSSNDNNNNEKNKIFIKKEEEEKVNNEIVEPKLTESSSSSSSSSEINNKSNNEENEDKTNSDNSIKNKNEFDNNDVIVDGSSDAADSDSDAGVGVGGGGGGVNADFSAKKADTSPKILLSSNENSSNADNNDSNYKIRYYLLSGGIVIGIIASAVILKWRYNTRQF